MSLCIKRHDPFYSVIIFIMIMESGKWQYHIMMQVRYDNRTINVYGIMYEWFHYHNEYLIAKTRKAENVCMIWKSDFLSQQKRCCFCTLTIPQ